MDWIKRHYDQFVLALLALVLLAVSAMYLLSAKSFDEKFNEASAPAAELEKIPPLQLERVDAAKKTIAEPAQWDARLLADKDPAKRGSLFVSELYILAKDGTPTKPKEGSLYNDGQTGKPIPNAWFLDNNLPLLEPTVAKQDPDKDGFFNEDEWRVGTDPNNAESHPPFHSKLFLKQLIKVSFRLILKGYDADPKKVKADAINFQIDTVDYKQPSSFLKLGEQVPNTKFKLKSFEFKETLNPTTGEMTDVSELTLVNVETEEDIKLVLDKVADSPDYFGLFDYQWPQPPLDIRVKKLGPFVLKPNVKEIYKLIDVNDRDALIQLPSGEKATITRYPAPR